MSCLDNIVSLGVCDDVSTSGFRLIDAPGISSNTLSKIANEDNNTGVNLALAKKRLALLKVKNDFLNIMAANAVSSDSSTLSYASGDILQSPLQPSSNYMGVTIHKANASDRIKKCYIKNVHFIPTNSGTVVLRIDDGDTSLSFNVAAIGGLMNSIDLSTLLTDGYYKVISSSAKVTIYGGDVTLLDSSITCLKGCNGRMPNPCAWVDGWDGTKAYKNKGFGVVIEFYCECDYEEVLCNLSDTSVGELIFLAWQIEIMQEHMMSNRFNNIVVYGAEEIRDYWLPSLKAEYKAKWNAFASNFKSVLSRFSSDCVKCKGIKWVTNL